MYKQNHQPFRLTSGQALRRHQDPADWRPSKRFAPDLAADVSPLIISALNWKTANDFAPFATSRGQCYCLQHPAWLPCWLKISARIGEICGHTPELGFAPSAEQLQETLARCHRYLFNLLIQLPDLFLPARQPGVDRFKYFR
jgi:hypothetical protein